MKPGWGILLFLLLGIGGHSQDDLFVSLKGRDTNPGTAAKPLQSLSAAISRVKNSKSKTVRISLRAGRYCLSKTLDITPEVLGGRHVLISNYPGEKVTITGSVPMKPVWNKDQGGVWKADIGPGLSIDQLICNGTPLPMARYPNFDSTARVFNGTAPDAISPERVGKWADPTGGYVHALHNAEWGDLHYVIKNKIGDSLVLEGGWQNNRPSRMHSEYRFVENIFEELDAPGEWYYNGKTGALYLIPPVSVDPATAPFERSVLNDIIRLKGDAHRPVEHVTIQGLTFTGTNRTFMQKKEPLLRSDWTIFRSGAILVEGGKDIEIGTCEFTGLGGNAVFISKYNRNVRCLHNHIHDIGAGAFEIVGDTGAVRSASFKYEQFVPINRMDTTPGPRTDNFPSDCQVYDNLIAHIGTIEKQIAGVEIDIAKNIEVSHNTIYEVPRAGINVGDGCFGGHVIAYNDVFKTVLETGDHGAFNSWGRDRYWLPGIEDVDSLTAHRPWLPLLDAGHPTTIRNNRFSCEHGWDIDLDDGSSNYQIYNNLCLNGGLKLREGFYRVVRNNVIVNNSFHPHVWYKDSKDIFAHNIVTTPYAPIRIRVWGERVDSNFFIQKTGLEEAHSTGTDRRSLGGDPDFMNEAVGDFRVKPGSGALRVGFVNFDMSAFGVVSPFLKRLAERPKITPVRTPVAVAGGANPGWLGAEIKNVETLGEQSASGLPDQRGVLVVKVDRGSIAEQNGLVAGDVIRSVNGKEVKDLVDFLSTMATVNWQGKVSAVIWHNQQPKEIQIRLK